jgi:hypothetical protein
LEPAEVKRPPSDFGSSIDTQNQKKEKMKSQSSPDVFAGGIKKIL